MGSSRSNWCWAVAAAAMTCSPWPSRGADSAAIKPSPAFTDVTKESGVAEAIARQYGAFPNWWLSGLNLVDLDGDGQKPTISATSRK